MPCPTRQTQDREEAIEAEFHRLKDYQDRQIAAWADKPASLWAGIGQTRPEEATDEKLYERATRTLDSQEAFVAAPRGRFIKAVSEMRALGFYEAEDLLSLYSRELADDRKPAPVASIRRGLSILNPMPDQLARDARIALTDMLGEGAAEMQEAA